MHCFHMIKKYGHFSIALILVLGVVLVSCAPSPLDTERTKETQEPTVESPEPAEMLETPALEPSSGGPQFVDDFEIQNLPEGIDKNGLSIGFVTWGDTASSVSIRTVEIPQDGTFSKPEQSGANRVLALTADVSGWGGLTHNFANETLDTWLTMDWRTSEGVSFRVYGLDSGVRLFFEIQENRNPDSQTNDVEIWSYPFVDDFSGWQQIQIPWDDFSRKDIGNGAPNDGLGLNEVHGWAFGMLTTTGEVTYYLDDVELYGERDPLASLEVAFTKINDVVREGGRARLPVSLSGASEDKVTVKYRIQDGQAVEYDDYYPIDGTLVFQPGSLTQDIVLDTVEDVYWEPVERLSVVLTEAEGANLGYARRFVLQITDEDQLPDGMLVDVEDTHPFAVTGEADVFVKPIQPTSDVLGVIPNSADPVRLTHSSPEPQDWTGSAGIQIWYHGTNSGQPVTIELLNHPGVSTAELDPDAWVLQWADEFDGPADASPDLTKWKPEIGDGVLNGNAGWGNSELEYYTGNPENVAMDGEGNLVITAKAIDDENGFYCWYGPCEYTSARLVTQDRYEFTYGRVETRMILPEGNGLWPAFWMLGNNFDSVGWPASGEVDIMEFIGRVPDTVYGSLHGPGYSGADNAGAAYVAGPEVSEQFHVYAVEWEPDEIRWYVDDVLFSTITAEEVNGQWVFDHPFFIIMNLAVGGNWPGNPDGSTNFPQELVVDYVRVYGAGDSHERFSVSFIDDFTGWQQVSLPFSDFTRSAVQPDGAPNDGLDLTQIFGYSLVLPGGENEVMLDEISLFE